MMTLVLSNGWEFLFCVKQDPVCMLRRQEQSQALGGSAYV